MLMLSYSHQKVRLLTRPREQEESKTLLNSSPSHHLIQSVQLQRSQDTRESSDRNSSISMVSTIVEEHKSKYRQ